MIVDASAAAQLTKVLQPGEYFRISIQAGGCNGFEKLFEKSMINADDIVCDHRVIVDKVSYDMVSNAILSYHQDLSGSRFELKIPEAASECGCGMSFDFKV